MTTYTLDELRGEERIDSRDLIEAREAAREVWADAASDKEEREEALLLVKAIDDLEAQGIEDWEYGAQLIREDCFEDFARDLAEDMGALPPDDSPWPLSCIDWKEAARLLMGDYSLVSFLGHDYYVR